MVQANVEIFLHWIKSSNGFSQNVCRYLWLSLNAHFIRQLIKVILAAAIDLLYLKSKTQINRVLGLLYNLSTLSCVNSVRHSFVRLLLNLPSYVVDLVEFLVCILVNNKEAFARLYGIRYSLPPIMVCWVRRKHRELELLPVDHVIWVEFNNAS